LCWEIGYQLIWLTRFVDAFASYGRGIALLGGHRSATRADLLGGTATLTGFSGAYDDATAPYLDAVEIARDFGDEGSLGRTEWGRTVVNWSNGRVADAITTGRAAIELLRRGDVWTLVDALAWTSLPLTYSGRPDEGRRLAEEAIELGARLGHVSGEIMGRRGAGFAAMLLGIDLDELERWVRADLEHFERIRSPWISQSHVWLATVLNLRGDVEGALLHGRTAIELEPVSAWSGVGWACTFLTRALAGERDACRTLLSEQRDLLPRPGETTTMGRFCMLHAAAQGCVVVGLTEEAGALYPLVAERADLVPLGVFDVALTQRVAGMAAAAVARWDDAEAHFEMARRQADEFPNRFDQPQVLHWYGKMLVDRAGPGDHDAAHTMLTDALEDYRRIGMPVYAAMTEALLGSLW
jgi:hypothetical protein